MGWNINKNKNNNIKQRQKEYFPQQRNNPKDLRADATHAQPTQIEHCQLDPELQKHLYSPRPVIPQKLGGVSFNLQGQPISYNCFSQSVIGQRHINENMEKEDNCFVEKSENGNSWAFALGDGHGDSNCVRSKTGSDLVSKIAVGKLLELEAGLRNDERIKLILNKNQQEALVRKMILSIKASWDDAVLQDLNEHPLTNEEWEKCDSYLETYRAGKSLEHLYGTTLIAGLATQDYLLLIQQGDGRCDVFHADGSVDQPIPWDDDCVGNATTSMCQPDAWQRCRCCVIDLHKDPVIACFAGSDGVEDSFRTMDDVHFYYRSKLMYALEHGVDELVNHLETALTELNQAGSMDDTTVVGIINAHAMNNHNLYERFQRENEAYRLLSAWDSADEALISKQGRLDHLRRKYEDIKQPFELLQKNEDAIYKFQYAEQFFDKFGCSELASQGITPDEYNAARAILEEWLTAHDNLHGKLEEYNQMHKKFSECEQEYREYYAKYKQVQLQKAKAARDLELLIKDLGL